MPFPKALKDPTTCRIFLSSPFRGMEEERQELMAKYIPELSHLCQTKGVSLVPVDLRWGITEEAADNAQVLSICLKELDRADIFVGLFGQRYGWQGKTDKMLQKNFDNAVEAYPWIDKYRDRSVTEVEFLHGHLNKPGSTPACFLFRDKGYDDKQRQSLTDEGKKKMADRSFVAESELTTKKLNTLRGNIDKTKEKCLAAHFDYKTPKEGAKMIFDAVYKHLNEVLLKDPLNVSKRDADLAHHDAFITSRSCLFVGGDHNIKILNQSLQSDSATPVVILGPAGSGKSALLSYWLSELKKKVDRPVMLYHFAGTTTDSTAIVPTLHRLIDELERIVGDSKTKVKPEEDDVNILGPGLTSADCGELVQKFQVLLEKACRKKKVVFVIDGLDKIENMSRIATSLFWLPTSFPRRAFAVFSCRQDDRDNVDELTRTRKYDVIKMEPLPPSARKEMCLRYLKVNGKELSPSQLSMIVEAEQSSSPLFLKTVLSELCKFGIFRKLDEKIGSLVKANGPVDLFKQLLSRLEIDYCVKESQHNVVEEVMCCLYLTHKGLSESELRTVLHIPAITWSPLYFAMCNFVVHSGGLMQLQFDEMKQAIYEKYLINESTRKKYLKTLTDFFESQRKALTSTMNALSPASKRPTEELPLLFKAMGDKNALIAVLTDLPIFGRLFLESEYELLELWKWIGTSGDSIAALYIAAMKDQIPNIPAEKNPDPDRKRGADLLHLMYLDALTYLLELGRFQSAKEKVLQQRLKILEGFASSMEEWKYERLMSRVHLKLASLYTDTQRFEEAEKLHQQVLAYREKMLSSKDVTDADLKDMGESYNALGMFYFKTDQTDKAIELFTKSVELQRKTENVLEVAGSLHNLGVLYIKKADYTRALQLCTQSLEIYEEQYFGHLTPEIGVMVGNIAVCHRNLGHTEEADQMYQKSLKINEKAFGRCHPNVAAVLKNLATMETNKENYKKAEEYYKETLDILEKCEVSKDNPEINWIRERLVYTVFKQGRVEEAISMFKDVYKGVSESKSIGKCWHVVYIRMVSALLEAKQNDLALKITLDMIQSEAKQDMNFVHLDILDSMLPSEKRPKRTKEFTLDHALTIWPGSINLVKRKIQNYLIPQDDSKALLTFLDKTDELCKLKQALFDNAIVWCEEQNKKALVLAISKHAAIKFPADEKYAFKACDILREEEKFEEAFPFAEQLLKLCSTRVDIILYVGEIAARAGKYDKARSCFQSVVNKHGKDKSAVEQAKAGLNIVASLSKTSDLKLGGK